MASIVMRVFKWAELFNDRAAVCSKVSDFGRMESMATIGAPFPDHKQQINKGLPNRQTGMQPAGNLLT
jgi:hypothetical protein